MTVIGKRTNGRFVACPNCGTEKWHYNVQPRPGRFCSRECWGLYRWARGLGGIVDFVKAARYTPATRQRVLGRMSGHLAIGARGNGRPPNYTADQQAAVLELREKNPRLGRKALAERIGISEKSVRTILGSQ